MEACLFACLFRAFICIAAFFFVPLQRDHKAEAVDRYTQVPVPVTNTLLGASFHSRRGIRRRD